VVSWFARSEERQLVVGMGKFKGKSSKMARERKFYEVRSNREVRGVSQKE